jgi:hypothetical protein
MMTETTFRTIISTIIRAIVPTTIAHGLMAKVEATVIEVRQPIAGGIMTMVALSHALAPLRLFCTGPGQLWLKLRQRETA